MRNWLATVSLDLFHSDLLQPEKKLCSAMTILCCLHLLRNRPYVRDVKEEVLLSLLRMAALSPSSGEKDFQYLLGMMSRDESRSVDFNVFKARFSFALDHYILCVQGAYSGKLNESV